MVAKPSNPYMTNPINLSALSKRLLLSAGGTLPRTLAHIYHGSKGGKVPGIRRANRRYPDGKPYVPVDIATEAAPASPSEPTT